MDRSDMPETAADQRIDQHQPDVRPDVPTAAPASGKKGTARVERVAKRFQVKDVDLYYGNFHAVQGVTMTLEANQVTALIGSSGCGKTTMLRSLNRMHELTPGARVAGQITLDDEDIYGGNVDPVEVRRLVGMVFQAPTPSRRCRSTRTSRRVSR
jgi:ABC-type glutathione transport system ATPase component